MGKRLSLDDKLSAIRHLRDLEPSSDVTAALRLALGDKSNLVVAAAADIASDSRYAGLCGDLHAAFSRFMVDPDSTDKLCRAKIAIVQALDKREHDGVDLFLGAVNHVQFEPVWGGQEDTAAPLRTAAVFALARLGYRGLLPLLADALVDRCKEVRLAAAQALGDQGTEAAVLLLRLKTRIGDKEPDVVSECLLGLLKAAPQPSLPLVTQFLDSSESAMSEAAMLALARSRIPEAFDLLRSHWQNHQVSSNETIYVAMAMLRLPAANEFLLELVANGSERSALAALSALLIYRYDPSLRRQIANAVQRSRNRSLKVKFEQKVMAKE